MKLCVFQGTFNPIHKAHLSMAEYVVQNLGFDKIIFIPAFKPPHKDYDINMSKHRYNMVRLAVDRIYKFEVSDIEFRRDGKSYTYLTIKELYKMFDIDGKIGFIIGTDAFEKIESWYMSDELKKFVKFIIFRRENNFKEMKFNYLREKGYDFEFTQMKFVDISSTALRNSLNNGDYISGLVTEEVEDYIKENGLYR